MNIDVYYCESIISTINGDVSGMVVSLCIAVSSFCFVMMKKEILYSTVRALKYHQKKDKTRQDKIRSDQIRSEAKNTHTNQRQAKKMKPSNNILMMMNETMKLETHTKKSKRNTKLYERLWFSHCARTVSRRKVLGVQKKNNIRK